MMSQGNADQVQKGKDLLKNAMVGLIIVLSAWGIATFIIRMIAGSTGDQQGGRPTVIPNPNFPPASSTEAIKSHFPARDAVNIPRNTKIIVTFNEKIDADTVIDKGDINDPLDDLILFDRIKIRRSEDHPINGPFVQDVYVAQTEDLKTFVFDPKPLLGNNTTPTSYTVSIGGQIKNMRGELVFANTGDYSWEFEVSTVIDNTPPKIVNVIPMKADPIVEEPRNVVVQIVFDEAIDPTSASGVVTVNNSGIGGIPEEHGDVLTNFSNITLSYQQDSRLIYFEGSYTMSNQYKTVEFTTNDKCGVNSCGEDIYCLPGGKELAALVRAATVSSEPPQAMGFPYDGIVDVAGNSLDGNSDGFAVGPNGNNSTNPPIPSDNYSWSFRTTNEVDLTPPVILYTPDYPKNGLTPGRYATNVPVGEPYKPASSPVIATFSKPLLHQSLTKQNTGLDDSDFWVEAIPIADQYTDVILMHPPFLDDTVYEAKMKSGIRDIYQNCFYDKDRKHIFNGCVGPYDENQANDQQTDLRQKTDLLYISKALKNYYQDNNTYIVSESGVNSTGEGKVNWNRLNDSRYANKSVIEKLSDLDYLDKEKLSFDADSSYQLQICAQGRTFSLSTKLAHPQLEIKKEGFLFNIPLEPFSTELNDKIISQALLDIFNTDNGLSLANDAKVNIKVNEQEWLVEDLRNESKYYLTKTNDGIAVNEVAFVNFLDEVCDSEQIVSNNHAVTSFRTNTVTGIREERDLLRKDDLSNLKSLLEAYRQDNQIYPGENNSCNYVKDVLVNTLSEYGQVYLDPISNNSSINDYIYIKFDDNNYALLAYLENVKDESYQSIELNFCPNKPIYSYCTGACDLISTVTIEN